MNNFFKRRHKAQWDGGMAMLKPSPPSSIQLRTTQDFPREREMLNAFGSICKADFKLIYVDAWHMIKQIYSWIVSRMCGDPCISSSRPGVVGTSKLVLERHASLYVSTAIPNPNHCSPSSVAKALLQRVVRGLMRRTT
jgi:hypothetical protein